MKAYNAEKQMGDIFESMNQELKQNGFKAQLLAGLMMPLMTFIGNLGYVAVCIVGAVLAMNDVISFGVIVAFIMYVRYFTQPLAQMAQAAQSLQSATAASHRVFEFLEAKEMEDESHKIKRLETAQGNVEFKNVTFTFEGSVKENLVYNQAHITDEQIEEACKAVGLHHFIQTLHHGYDTILDDKLNLSAGQKQQLTIARAMLKNSPMLILDEATSSVDTRTELIIQQAMDQLMEGRTSFVIAHRLSTIKNADVILVLKDGDILESGNHESLLAKQGFYAELYNSQFEQA